jgi:hypothetical protein
MLGQQSRKSLIQTQSSALRGHDERARSDFSA